MWALHKHFPHVKIYVRAHDVMHGLNLEKASPLLLLLILPCVQQHVPAVRVPPVAGMAA